MQSQSLPYANLGNHWNFTDWIQVTSLAKKISTFLLGWFSDSLEVELTYWQIQLTPDRSEGEDLWKGSVR